ncbi:alpha/beta-hydrolase [Thelephora ganbajun]|uniref:Alpha/beta-hydrolase n=1 Tax=Thelephora ganbajun TaxID=370292 RepID=A0ACB6ZWQ4_THEGA|nr:alpha/beta-hydrolase [Thelephora ganbajun]
MIDHIFGRPSPSWKRTQVSFVLIFWIWRLVYGREVPPRLFWLRKMNRALARFSPWQIIVGTLTAMYASQNLDKFLGLGAPEPLADLYSPSYYRATWIATGLDAGFATAMAIRPKWLRDICAILFSAYYIIYANEADEKVRKFRAAPTVEFLRTTWEKTSNPYIRLFSWLPKMTIRRVIQIPRPSSSTYTRPITVHLFFAPHASKLAESTELILDIPGGGFVSMTPEHHEERLCAWAEKTGRPVLSLDYGKAPEYPYPYAVDEVFDAYQVLVDTAGAVIGMSGRGLEIIASGDSAGAHILTCVIIKILESKGLNLKLPLALVLNYPALDFNFTSWMSKDHLKVLRAEDTSATLKDFTVGGRSDDWDSPVAKGSNSPRRLRLRRSTPSLKGLNDGVMTAPQRTMGFTPLEVESKPSCSGRALPGPKTLSGNKSSVTTTDRGGKLPTKGEGGVQTDLDSPENTTVAHIRFSETGSGDPFDDQDENHRASIGRGRVTMTSRTGYFQDRIIPPSMMRAMAILYLSNRNPDFSTDYQVSPIIAPSEVLARFPRVLMQCGEKDPFVDDTIIFAGRLRESKRARLRELSTKMERGECSEPEGEEWARLNAESEEDWVEMALFPEWSHGYLQMGRLMKEATAVIVDIGVWIGEVFEGSKATGSPQSNHSHKSHIGGDSIPSDAGGEADSGIGSPSLLPSSTSAASSGNSSASHQQQQLLKTITEGELLRRRRLLGV